MDLQNNMQPKLGKLEEIIRQFLLKFLQLILVSRVPSLRPKDLCHGRRCDKWFHLALGDRPSILNNLHFWHRNLKDPMRIDIILVHQVAGSSVETVIERWVVRYQEDSHVVASQTGHITDSHKKTYQTSIILFRALYTHLRLLPAYKIFRELCASNSNNIVYKVSSFSDPLPRSEAIMMDQYHFLPVIASPGKLFVSVIYRTKLSDLNFQSSTSLPAKVITDSVGQSSTQTAPVIIPRQVMDKRSAKSLSHSFSDSGRSSLPSLSHRPKASSLELPFGIKSIRRLTTSRIGKMDEFDDGDFSCPFDVDDVDVPDVKSSQNVGSKSVSEISSSLQMGEISQNAAVGVLVHKLRTAPPLRQNPSNYSSNSSKAQLEGGVATASGFTRKMVDASEELRSYREIRDLLLSKRGSQILNKDKAPEQ